MLPSAHVLDSSEKFCALWQIYIRSTDVDRTLMSASSNLAGLYPPDKWEEWNPQLEWQPLPVHTVPVPADHVSD